MMPSRAPGARRPLIVATTNPGKLREFRALLSDLPFDLHSLGDLGVTAPEETGSSFLDNALLKARHAAAAGAAAVFGGAGTPDAFRMAGTPDAAAIADDSGLEVDALDGAPGIYSARYAGEDADDAANNAKLMSAMAGVPAERRRARYRCVLVWLSGAKAAPLTAEGVWEGSILDAPRGTGGFGYDPYFWLPDLGLTAAQLDAAEKNRLSHRAIAMRALRDQLLAREQPAREQPARRHGADERPGSERP